jgi:hypothetical protein
VASSVKQMCSSCRYSPYPKVVRGMQCHCGGRFIETLVTADDMVAALVGVRVAGIKQGFGNITLEFDNGLSIEVRNAESITFKA